MVTDQKRQRRLTNIGSPRLPYNRRDSRRGVLLLVVLSMLVLFMLIGTAFLMSSSQERKTAKNLSKVARVGNYGTKELDRGLLQVLRDTDNPYSVVRYHSLLRDLYGTDGLQGVIYSPLSGTDPKTADGQVTSFAGANPANAVIQTGPTNGQFIDIYVRALGWDTTKNSSVDDPFTLVNEGNPPTTLTQPDGRHVLRLDRTALGLPQIYPLPPTKGYFNGQLLTITSGPAAGQSTRILDYDFISDIKPTVGKPTDSVYVPTRLFRFRVMAFQRSDGQALQQTRRPPEIDELAGQSFMVNGRAFSGTGAGYNPLAAAGQPRLSALQLFPVNSAGGLLQAQIGANASQQYLGGELALLPNSVYYDPASRSMATGVSLQPGVDPFSAPFQAQLLNNPIATRATNVFYNYQSYPGPGDMNESYDAADFQNMFLALQTVTPRAQGRVVQKEGGTPVTRSAVDPAIVPANFLRLDLEDLPIPSFFRPDLSNFWFHRLLNSQWLKTAITDDSARVTAILQPYDSNGNVNPAVGGLSPQIAATITAIKRQSSLRPLREDNPHFNGSNPLSVPTSLPTTGLTVGTAPNLSIAIPYWEAVGPWDVDNDNDGIPDSVWVDLGDPVQEAEDGTRYKRLYAFLIIDLDSRLNVNAHGLADEIVSPANDTTRNVYFDSTYGLRGGAKTGGNIAHDPSQTNTFPYSTLQLSRGIGYGPAEISLRPLFPAPIINPDSQPVANRDENAGPIDSYATLLFGRNKLDGSTVNGKYGFAPNLGYPGTSIGDAATAGSNYRYAKRNPNWLDNPATVPDSPLWYTGEQASPTLLAQLKFFDHPWSSIQWKDNQSGFGTLPDMKGRYALGLDYFGQPVNEGANDVNPNTANLAANLHQPFNLLAKSPYELDLSSTQRRDDLSTGTSSSIPDKNTEFTQTTESLNVSQAILGKNDDAAFSPTDLEKVLRAWDVDSGALPSRLWDSVDAFDPVKLIRFDPNDTVKFANNLLDPVNNSIGLPANNKLASAELMAGAQQLASINRRLVTTDSYDLPVVASSAPNLAALTFGPDGQPGRAKQDGSLDPAQTVGAAGSDDFQSVMAKDPARASIVDLLQYRVWTEARRFEMRRQGLTEFGASNSVASLSAANFKTFMDTITARVNLILAASPNLVSDLLAPEVIAGKKMDLNRPFGDGQDNNDDGVVDDPFEAGDPFLDINGNGQYDFGEPYIDLFNKPKYQGPIDHPWSNLSANGTLAEQISFDYTNGHEEPLCVVLANQIKTLGGVRNLESQGRQLFARHLYCLMLLLVDDNYIAPWDENDAQLMAWMTAEKAKLTAATTPTLTPEEADFIVKRKATCKMIAQWAVNCVDMRDPDVISTPFEFDENPWDGWGVWSDKWNVDVSKLPAPIPPLAATVADLNTRPSFIPLDGDPASDENKAEVIDWKNVPVNTAATGQPSNINQRKLTAIPDSSNPMVTHPLNQTRGLVWGAERPELLITETLAFHDRRTEDLQTADSSGGHGQFQRSTEQPNPSTASQYYPDTDLDQGLMPQGAAFVELYNPWSPAGQLPSELYSQLTRDTATGRAKTVPSQGVELGRLSNYGVDTNGRLSNVVDAPKKLSDFLPPNSPTPPTVKRSPVWRLIVVSEWPDARNTDEGIPDNHMDLQLAPGLKEPAAYTAQKGVLQTWGANPTGLPPWRPTNPDFDPLFGADTWQTPGVTKLVGSSFATVPKPVAGQADLFNVAYPFIEREFYFTTDKSPVKIDPNVGEYQYDMSNNRANFKLRIPDRSMYFNGAKLVDLKAETQKFIPPGLEWTSNNQPVIAPVMPERFAVVGTAGTNYGVNPGGSADSTDDLSPFNPKKQVFTVTIGRQAPSGKSNALDDQHEGSVNAHSVRRIEMRPLPFSSNPPAVNTLTGRAEAQIYNPVTKSVVFGHQLLVGSNGGDPKDEIQLGNTYDPFSREMGRDNELIVDMNDTTDPAAGKPGSMPGTIKNIYDSTASGGAITGEPSFRYYPPCVSIPVDDMNVSEPPWGYSAREKDAIAAESAIRKSHGKGDAAPLTYRKTVDHKEGRYFRGQSKNIDSYDKPFDGWTEKPIAPELMRTGTTANYRVFHLQRLANPMLPWNPQPLLADGKTANPEYNANLPINPYLTVDTASVNLTAFNGTSRVEHDLDPDVQNKQGKIDPGNLVDVGKYLTNFDASRQVWDFRSQERGFWSRVNSPTATTQVLPQRVLWAQEPANILLKKKKGGPEILDLIPGREMTMRYVDEVPDGQNNTTDIKGRQVPSHGDNFINMVLKHSLGFGNESYGLLYDVQGAKHAGSPAGSFASTAPTGAAIGAPAPSRFIFDNNLAADGSPTGTIPMVTSTNPWMHWGNRPFVSAEELLNVPMASQSTMLRQYSTVDPNMLPATRPDPYGLLEVGTKFTAAPNANRWAVMQTSFGQMANMFAASVVPFPPGASAIGIQGTDVARNLSTGVPTLDAKGNVQPYGAPNFYRILDFVQVPSRFVGTDTMLNAETFNDVPNSDDSKNIAGTAVGSDIPGTADPRYNFQPPFNKVSRERDPGKVNLNTVTGRRVQTPSTAAAQIWSEVYDGIMHRLHDANPAPMQLGESGPAWRDVVLSRRGYVQVDAQGGTVDKSGASPPDVFQAGLNPSFPTMFANPFRAAAAGDLVPLQQMLQYGVDATFERVHPRNRGVLIDADGNRTFDPKWGDPTAPVFGDARDAGLSNDGISVRANGAIPSDLPSPTSLPKSPLPYNPVHRDILPLFSDRRADAYSDTDRNPYMMYKPMSRLGNLVTDHSNVYAIWVTVGYFEVEKAPDWTANEGQIQQRLGGDGNAASPASLAAQALYNRIYPEGYMLGKEVGSDTGDVKRPRGFYIIDRSEAVGFRPGEDLNVEKLIRLRRRIE